MQDDKKLTQNYMECRDALLKRAYELRDKCRKLAQEIIASSDKSPVKGYISEEEFNKVLKLQEENSDLRKLVQKYEDLKQHIFKSTDKS